MPKKRRTPNPVLPVVGLLFLLSAIGTLFHTRIHPAIIGLLVPSVITVFMLFTTDQDQ
jgi:hypothetical protein